MQHQNWYTPFVKNERLDYACYENYSVVSISYFQYIIMAVSFSQGEPYRKPIYTNYSLVISLLIGALVSVYMTLCPGNITNFFSFSIEWFLWFHRNCIYRDDDFACSRMDRQSVRDENTTCNGMAIHDNLLGVLELRGMLMDRWDSLKKIVGTNFAHERRG